MSSWLDEWGAERLSHDAAKESHAGHGSHGGGMEGMLTEEQLAKLATTTGTEFDELFAQYMIEHHLGAVTMAEDVLSTGTDPRVKKLAESIIAAQEAEIQQMQDFLNRAE